MDEFSTEKEPVRVKFGPGKTQDVPLEWAETMLTMLRDKHQNVFGKLLIAAADRGGSR